MDRLVQVAIARHMPAQADARAQAAADGRRFDIDTRQHDLAGTATVYGTLDLADALDLETAVAGVAATLKDLGSTDTLDVRRAAAVGEIARHQLTLDLTTSPGPRRRPTGGSCSTSTSPKRRSPAPTASDGWATSTPPSPHSRSGPGAAPLARSP